MSSSLSSNKRNQVMVGPLPDDFLRIPINPQANVNGFQPVTTVQHQQPFTQVQLKKLKISLVEAKMVKNYGLTRMDPYARVRFGNGIYESHTAVNGGKNPCWNKDFYISPSPGVDSVYVEIYDECSFTPDDRIAWAHIPVPVAVYDGVSLDEWFPLNGKQGDQKEGSIHLIISYANYPSSVIYSQPYPMALQPFSYPTYVPNQAYLPGHTYITTIPNVTVMPQPYPQSYLQPYPQIIAPQPVVYQSVPQSHVPVHQPAVGPYVASPADIDALAEMFPQIEKEIVGCILEQCHGNKDAAINHLLSM